MNTKALRSKILDLAIHGKLLSEKEAAECRKGETATELLEKIRKEKEDKIAKGELKADKKSSYIFTKDCEFDEGKLGKHSEGMRHRRHYEQFADETVKCVEDEIPFEVPDGWAWCRLGEICDYGNCTNVEAINISDDAWILDLEDIEKDTGNIISFQTKHSRNFESTKHIFKKGQLLYSKLRPYLNKVLIAPKDGFCTSEILPLDFGKKIEPSYMRYVLMSAYFLEYANMCSYGVKMPRLGTEDGKKGFIPLPPLSEQKTIIAKIEEIFAQIDILENSKIDLQTTTKHAKSKILALAIHGKLVPQDPNDEPASKLLDRIHSNCEFDEGKQGKRSEKILHNGHYEKLEDVPFDIPDGWVWCKLGEICLDFIVPQRDKPKKFDGNIPWCRIEDIQGKYLNGSLSNQNVSEETVKNMNMHICPINSLIVACSASLGNQAIVKKECCTNQTFIGIVNDISYLDTEFLYYFFSSQKQKLLEIGTGTTIKYVSREKFENYNIPLPPLAEQKRIVSKIESLFSLLDKIQSELN